MDDWEKIARDLPCGRTSRVQCCGSDRSRVITHNEKGYSTYCFRCGEDSREFRGRGARSLTEMMQHRKELDTYINEVGDIQLPKDFTTEIPTTALSWFFKYGVSFDVVKHYRFGWSEAMQRIVLPVYDTSGRLRTTQSRAVYKGQVPKYMNKKAGDMRSVAFYSDDAVMLSNDIQGTVITEDILSAVRVGRLIPALSTLGTTLSFKLITASLYRHLEPYYIWYDGDEAGVKGARQAKNNLDLLGYNSIIIKTDKDPKEYNNEDIIKILEEHEIPRFS